MAIQGLNGKPSYSAVLDATHRRLTATPSGSFSQALDTQGAAAPTAGDAERERYKITGPGMSMTEALERNGGRGVIRPTPEQIAEMALYDQQTQAREAAAAQYVASHPDQVYGQVVVNGKLFATVYESGSAVTPYAMRMTENGSGTALAKTRLAEIARAAGGQVIYDHFHATPDNPGGVVPESALPRVTARSHAEILMEMLSAYERRT